MRVIMYYAEYEDPESPPATWHWVMMNEGRLIGQSVIPYEEERECIADIRDFLNDKEEVEIIHGVKPNGIS